MDNKEKIEATIKIAESKGIPGLYLVQYVMNHSKVDSNIVYKYFVKIN